MLSKLLGFIILASNSRGVYAIDKPFDETPFAVVITIIVLVVIICACGWGRQTFLSFDEIRRTELMRKHMLRFQIEKPVEMTKLNEKSAEQVEGV